MAFSLGREILFRPALCGTHVFYCKTNRRSHYYLTTLPVARQGNKQFVITPIDSVPADLVSFFCAIAIPVFQTVDCIGKPSCAFAVNLCPKGPNPPYDNNRACISQVIVPDGLASCANLRGGESSK